MAAKRKRPTGLLKRAPERDMRPTGHVVRLVPGQSPIRCCNPECSEHARLVEYSPNRVSIAFYYYCPVCWHKPAADDGPSAADRTGVDASILAVRSSHAPSYEALLAQNERLAADVADYERRWIAECRAHGDTRQRLEARLFAAQHELGDHSDCHDPERCERSMHEPDNDGF